MTLHSNYANVAVELFSGSCVVADTLRAEGFDVLTIDINKEYGADVSTDIAGLNISDLPEKYQKPFFVWASPPCNTFSILRIGHNWDNKMGVPVAKNVRAAVGVYLVYKTLCLIHDLSPRYWVIENPVGKLRAMPFMKALPKRTITYCQYGELNRKPTDIWNNITHWKPRPMCKNGGSCHIAAPRGSDAVGKAGKNNAFERAKVPAQLVMELIAAMRQKPTLQTKLEELR